MANLEYKILEVSLHITMKQNMTAALLNFLQTNNVFYRYDLIFIALPNGQTVCASSCPVSVTWGNKVAQSPLQGMGNTFWRSKFGVWERGAITSEVSETPKAGSMSLTVAVESEALLPDLMYPGTQTPLFQAATLGLFDAAEVWVYSFWTAADETPQQGLDNKGVMVMFGGLIGAPERSSRSKFSFKVDDMLYILNVPFPVNVVQSGCAWALYGPQCTLNKAVYAFTTSVAASSSASLIVCSTTPTVTVGGHTFSSTTGDYSQGRLTFISGQNAGLTYYIKQNTYASGVASFFMASSILLPLQVGDQFICYPGCDKTVATCNKFVNIQNRRGFNFVPNPEVAA